MKKEPTPADDVAPALEKRPECFVIMPLSDMDPYPAGHFRRVYDFLIAPACTQAGFNPVLGGDVKEGNLIIVDILRRLHRAEMVICDLSGKNPNVLFELGFRQAFDRPVTLIRDDKTDRIFDVSGLRDITYDHTLRIDTAATAISAIAESMKATYRAAQGEQASLNSLVQLLSIESAAVPQRSEISADTQILLNAIRELGDRVGTLEAGQRPSAVERPHVPVRVQRPPRREVTVEYSGDLSGVIQAAGAMRSFASVHTVYPPVHLSSTEFSVQFDIEPGLALSTFEAVLKDVAGSYDVRVVRMSEEGIATPGT